MKCVLCGKYIGPIDSRHMTERGPAHVNCFTALGGEDPSDTRERIRRETEARRRAEMIEAQRQHQLQLQLRKEGLRPVRCWKCGVDNWTRQIQLEHRTDTELFVNRNPGIDLSRVHSLPDGWHYRGWDCGRCSSRNFAVWFDAPPKCKYCKMTLPKNVVKCPNCGAPTG